MVLNIKIILSFSYDYIFHYRKTKNNTRENLKKKRKKSEDLLINLK